MLSLITTEVLAYLFQTNNIITFYTSLYKAQAHEHVRSFYITSKSTHPSIFSFAFYQKALWIYLKLSIPFSICTVFLSGGILLIRLISFEALTYCLQFYSVLTQILRNLNTKFQKNCLCHVNFANSQVLCDVTTWILLKFRLVICLFPQSKRVSPRFLNIGKVENAPYFFAKSLQRAPV